MTRYIPTTKPDGSPRTPHPKQAAFMLLNNREAFYGGAAGGGKSDALLMAALQYVDVPGYAALIVRRTYSQLTLPDSIMDRAHQWLGGTGAIWNGDEHQYTFPPSGATLTFGHMQHESDKYRYQGPAFQYVGFDELTQFLESQYRYMFSRLRRLAGSTVPLRVRGASNPGGIGHDWVYRRLVDNPTGGRIFIPAKLDDNPSLDREEYVESLNELDPVTLAQLLGGDWTVRAAGSKFRREWFEIVDLVPTPARQSLVRFWDLAGTEPRKGEDPDWTVGVKMCRAAGNVYVLDVQRIRGNAQAVDRLIEHVASVDGRECAVRMEQEPGSSGKRAIEAFTRGILAPYDFKGTPSTGSKEVRAGPFASQAAAGNVKLLRGAWNGDYVDELAAFPLGPHDDQVDASSGAYLFLTPTRSWKVA